MLSWQSLAVMLALLFLQPSEATEIAAMLNNNYASNECAASIVRSDQSIKGADSILSPNKDSYMIFECSPQSQSVVIKLCKDILVDRVEVDNFEYFSSMFKTITISASEHLSDKESDWTVLGKFESEPRKGEHSFQIHSPKIWANYMRLGFAGQWDEEVFCPINNVRVFGINMIDHLKMIDLEDQRSMLSASSTSKQSRQSYIANAARTGHMSLHSDRKEKKLAVSSLELPDDPCAEDDDEDDGPGDVKCGGSGCKPSASGTDQAAPVLGNKKKFCPAAVSSSVFEQSESSLLSNGTCKVPKPPKSPFDTRICCINPQASLRVPSTVAVVPVPQFKESVYENIFKRLGLLENTFIEHREKHDQMFAAQVSVIESFFNSLNKSLVEKVGTVARENQRLELSVLQLQKEIIQQRKLLGITIIAGCVFVLLVVLRSLFKVAIMPQRTTPSSFPSPTTTYTGPGPLAPIFDEVDPEADSAGESVASGDLFASDHSEQI